MQAETSAVSQVPPGTVPAPCASTREVEADTCLPINHCEGAADRDSRPHATSPKVEVEAHTLAAGIKGSKHGVEAHAGYRSSPVRRRGLNLGARGFGDEREQNQRARQD